MNRALAILSVLVAVSIGLVACDGVRPSDRLPAPTPGADQHLIGPASATPYRQDGVGAMRTNCKISHYNYSDPILFPGQPLASHLHVFSGNTATNYRSTPETIANAGGSTCTGGTANRTAYWAPALIDTGGRSWRECAGPEPHEDCLLLPAGGDKAQAVDCGRPGNTWTRFCIDESNAMQHYYKTGYDGVASNTVQNWPAGLRMIAGTSTSTSAQPVDVAWWSCKPDNQGQQVPSYSTIIATNCRPGQLLVMAVEFPQCWNGRDLDSPDHKSHMSYGAGWPDKGCPVSHPVPLPQVTTWVYYRLPEGVNLGDLRLASDMYDGPGGYSGHADWMNGWDPDVFQKVVDNCYQPGLDCQMNLLGDGTQLGGP